MVVWQQYRLCLARAEIKFSAINISLFQDPSQERFLVVQGTISSEEIPLPMDSLARKATQEDVLIIVAIFCNRLSLYRSRVSVRFQWDDKFAQFLEIVYRRQK